MSLVSVTKNGQTIKVQEEALDFYINSEGYTPVGFTYKAPSASTPQPTAQPSTNNTAQQVNSLYQKYFGRDANTSELNFWKTQPISTLETQLGNDYKASSGVTYDNSPILPGKQKTENQLKVQPTSTTQQTTSTSKLTLQTLLGDPKIKGDLGVNGTTMGKWLEGNASLLPKLEALGYTVQDLINEAYAQTRTNKSAFSGDMTTTPKSQNTGLTIEKILEQVPPEQKQKDANVIPTTPTEPPKPTQDFVNYSDLPTSITSSPDWAVLPDEYKKAFYTTYHSQRLTNEASKLDALDALKQAEALADPSFKEALRISQDELTQGISSLQGDFTSKKTTLETRIKNIQEDLTYNKGELDLNQQADLAQQAQKYKSDLFNLQQTAAESGLAFSSPRSTAESQMATQNQGLVISTNRAYAQKQRNLAFESARSSAENQQSLVDLQRQQQENLLKLQRAGETTMGTANVGQIPGVNQLGGITGSLAEKKQTDVFNLQGALRQRQNPFQSLF